MNTGTTAQPVSTTTQSKEPWAGATPYLTSMYGTAAGWRENNVGYNPYPASTLVDIDPTQRQGMSDIEAIAGRQVDANAMAPSLDLAQQMVASRGMTPRLTNVGGSLYTLAEMGDDPYKKYQQIYGDTGAQDIFYIFNDTAAT